jgi:hypothetical protein
MIRPKVAEALQGEVGYGRGRLDTLTRNELGLSIGDIVEIHGRRRDPTVAIVWRARKEDEGKGIIRVDGLIRNNAEVNLGDKVEVKKAQVKPAQKVVLAPVMDQSEKIQLGHVIEEVILRGLYRRPITKGDVLTVPGLTLRGVRLPFGVIEVQPKGIIQLQADTVIQVHETPIKEEELTKTKEDIRLEKLEKIKQREEALDFDTAIEIWEELGKPLEAARVRKLKAEQGAVKVDQTVVHGDYVDDRDTIVKDSVLNRTNIGSDGDDKFTRLEKLTEMKKEGLIDDDEFKQMKKEILGK